MHHFLKLCLVTNIKNQSFSAYQKFLKQAIQGGVTSVQLREKTANLTEFHHLALKLNHFLKPYQIPLIINDHVEIARDIDAAGVHIGQSDISPQKARDMLGPDKIIGLSIESLDELTVANSLTCIDYVGASAVFPSKTKPDCKTIWGLTGLEQLTSMSKFPVVAIGGINESNVAQVMQTQVAGVAVIGALHDPVNPELAARILLKNMQAFNEQEQPCYRRSRML